MKFKKAKYKVLYEGQDNPKDKYRLSRKGMESSPEKTDKSFLTEKDCQEAQRDLAMCVFSPEHQTHPGLHEKEHGQWAKGGSPLFRSSETPPGGLHPTLAPSA